MRNDCKPHPDGTLLSIFWPDNELATVRKCPLASSGDDGMPMYACMACRQCRGFFSPGRPISAMPMDIQGHLRVLFQQVICEHPDMRRKDEETS